jgi:hypothetical protein
MPDLPGNHPYADFKPEEWGDDQAEQLEKTAVQAAGRKELEEMSKPGDELRARLEKDAEAAARALAEKNEARLKAAAEQRAKEIEAAQKEAERARREAARAAREAERAESAAGPAPAPNP